MRTSIQNENIDRQIADEIVKVNNLSISKLGLRFDSVVVRLLGNLRIVVEQTAPKGKTVIMTISAPIKHPKKTGIKLVEHINELYDLKHKDTSVTVFQNSVQLRLIETSSMHTHKFVGFVHNPRTDS